jgi:hypothetical protein
MNVKLTGGKSGNYDLALASLQPGQPLTLVFDPMPPRCPNAVRVDAAGAVWAICGYLKDELVNHWAATGIKPSDWIATFVRPTWSGGRRTGGWVKLERRPSGGGLPPDQQQGGGGSLFGPRRATTSTVHQELDPEVDRALASPTESESSGTGSPGLEVLRSSDDERPASHEEPLHGETDVQPDVVDGGR